MGTLTRPDTDFASISQLRTSRSARNERRSRMRGAHAARGDLRSMTPAGVTFVLVASGFSVLRYVFRAVGKNTGYYTGSGVAF